jgi:hypothetical protein
MSEWRRLRGDPAKVNCAMIVACLNVGVKPPGAIDCDEVAKLEAWCLPEEISKSPDEAGEIYESSLLSSEASKRNYFSVAFACAGAGVIQALEAQYERGIGRNTGLVETRA